MSTNNSKGSQPVSSIKHEKNIQNGLYLSRKLSELSEEEGKEEYSYDNELDELLEDDD
jgi:hypothetical protein